MLEKKVECQYKKFGKTIGGGKVIYCDSDCKCEHKGELVYVQVKPFVFYQFYGCKEVTK